MLSCGVVCVMRRLAVPIEHRLVADERMDRHTTTDNIRASVAPVKTTIAGCLFYYEAKCIVVTAVCLSVCVSVRVAVPAAFPHYCTDPDVTQGNGRGAFLLCTTGRNCNRYTGFVADNTTPNAKCQRVLVLALCVVKAKFHYAS